MDKEREPLIQGDEFDRDEILGRSPHWFIRTGIAVLSLTFLLLVLLATFVKYPDVVTTRVTLTSEAPPVSLVARSSGRLHLLIRDNDSVNVGEYLAFIENPARVQDVRTLHENLKLFKKFMTNTEQLIPFQFAFDTTLGELQNDYADFRQAYLDYELLLRVNHYKTINSELRYQIDSQRQLQATFIKQKESMEDQEKLAREKFDRQTELFRKMRISETDRAAAETEYLQHKHDLEIARGILISSSIQLAKSHKTLLSLQRDSVQTSRVYIARLQECYRKLLAHLKAWETQYVLDAPYDGIASFSKYWANGHDVKPGEEIMTTIPFSSNIIGRAYVTKAGAGRIATGQSVNIMLDDFPYTEFGLVKGEVVAISRISRDGQYVINIRLPQGLVTSYRKTVQFNREMLGDADVITEDISLIARLFYPARYFFSASK